MGQRAADGAPVTDLRMGDKGNSLLEQRRPLGHQRLPLEPTLPGHRSDSQATLRSGSDEIELGQTVEIDQYTGPREPKVEQGYEALPTRQEFGVIAVLPHQRQGGIEGIGCYIVERCWLHSTYSTSPLLTGQEGTDFDAAGHDLDLDLFQLLGCQGVTGVEGQKVLAP